MVLTDDNDVEKERAPSDVDSSADDVSIQSAPDGGWGWMVVLAVFVGNFLIDGCAGSFGILYPALLDEFGSSPAMTSMAGSVIVAVYLFSSPLVGSLLNRFGCRRVCFAGGCVTAFGFIVSSMVPNITLFILTFGVLGGFGLGLNSLSGHVMVNSYFNKRRGIAGGIVSSGAGFGVFVCAPLLQNLIRAYAWRGAVLVFSGVMLHFCVAAVLMRPLAIARTYQLSDTVSESGTEHKECEEKQDIPSEELAQSIPLIQSTDSDRPPRRSSHEIPSMVIPNKPFDRPPSARTYMNGSVAPSATAHTNNDRFYSTYNISCDKTAIAIASTEVSNLNSLPDLSICAKNRSHNTKYRHVQRHVDNKRLHEERNHHHHHVHHHAHHHHGHQYDPIHPHQHRKHLFKPLLRKDIFYSGSLHHLPEYQKADSVSDFVHSMILPETDSISETSDDENVDDNLRQHSTVTTLLKKCLPRRNQLCDISIFRNSVYIPMLLGAVFIQVGQFIPSTFIPKYCEVIGLSKDQVSTILSIFGAVNILGRLSAGALANVKCISTLWVCNGAMFTCAVCCAMFPLCTTFTTVCIYTVGFAYFIGYFPPLQVLIMVKYLGLDKLSSSVGFLQMAKGPAALIGPPLAGVVYEWTQDYTMCMEFAAVFFFLAALVQSLVPLIDRCSGNQSQDSAQVIEIEIYKADSDSNDSNVLQIATS